MSVSEKKAPTPAAAQLAEFGKLMAKVHDAVAESHIAVVEAKAELERRERVAAIEEDNERRMLESFDALMTWPARWKPPALRDAIREVRYAGA